MKPNAWHKKERAVLELGGECNECVLICDSDNLCLFQFHHKNPKDKIHALSYMFNRKSWEEVLRELRKCQLLCSNCHNLMHSVKF